ncbi:MAG: RNase adapter RapZ [Coriobacteriia bacterium]|nr:RNase adapter RapZ [Coriobacteriia bacterium]
MTDESEPVSGGSAESRMPELVVITGMSGAGRSETIHTFEDLGYFCIDNLPPSFIRQLVDLTALPGNRIRRLAVVCDVRGQAFFDELAGELKRLADGGVTFHLLFLEASDEVLLRRFKETRRRHPLCDETGSVAEGIQAEREALSGIRGRADLVVDTSDLRPQDLRRVLKERFFSGNLASTLSITVTSFGFKYGVPSDADIVMDVRFLPNPYYNHELRERTGLEQVVRDFVLGREETGEFLGKWYELLATLAPGYLMEGKTHLAVALGCTGGMHRSVVLAEETAEYLRDLGYSVATSHRDIGRDRERL